MEMYYELHFIDRCLDALWIMDLIEKLKVDRADGRNAFKLFLMMLLERKG
jgi:hypothetical protein